MIFLESISVGDLETNCYLVGQENSFVLIDPGSEPKKIAEQLAIVKNKCKAIICTHGHYDHIGAVASLKKEFSIPVWLHEDDEELLERMFQVFGVERFAVDRLLKTDEVLHFGDGDLKVIHTPGHTPGGICLYTDGIALTGDTLFADGYLGRTDLPGGSDIQIMDSLQKLLELPDNTKVYPGHGPASTIAKEKELHHKVGQRT
ncbi:MBL fold metallo-hydrolase [Candidatus Margulisiibacteriota bacterium]